MNIKNFFVIVTTFLCMFLISKHCSAALAEAGNDIIFLDCVDAVHKNTSLSKETSAIVAEYRGGFEEPKLIRVWQRQLSFNGYSAGFAKPLSGNRVAAISANGNVTVYSSLTGEAMNTFTNNDPSITWVKDAQELPDGRLVMASCEANLDVVDIENSQSKRYKMDIPTFSLACVEATEGPELMVANDTEIHTYSFDLDNPDIFGPLKSRFNYRNIRSLKKISPSVVCFAAINERGSDEIFFYNAERQTSYGKGIELRNATDILMDMCGNQLAVHSRGSGSSKSSLVLYSDKDNFRDMSAHNAVPVSTIIFLGPLFGLARIGNVLAVNRYNNASTIDKNFVRLQELGEGVTQMCSDHEGLVTLHSCRDWRNYGDAVVKMSYWKRQPFQEQQKESKRKKCKKNAAIATVVAAPIIGILAAMYNYL